MAEAMYARVHPHEPKRGYKIKIFVVFGQKFESSRGWYRVSPALAEKLRVCKQDAYDPDAKLVFQIATEAEAHGIAREDYAKVNPEVIIERAIAGAQDIDEDALDIPEEDAYGKQLKGELYEMAEGRGLEVSSAMKKSELIEALRADDAKGEKDEKNEEEIPFS